MESKANKSTHSGRPGEAAKDMQTITVQTQSGALMAVTLSKEMIRSHQTFSIHTDRGEELFMLNTPADNGISAANTEKGFKHNNANVEDLPKMIENVNDGENSIKLLAGAQPTSRADLDSKVGKYILYYCKSCIFHSPVEDDVIRHVSSGQCSVADSGLPVSSTLALSALEAIEHNYAICDEYLMGGQSDTVLGQALSGFPIDGCDPSLMCPVCPHTRIYSNTELEEHQLCHTASGQPDLFSCYICQVRTKRGRPLTTNGDWQKTKTHLNRIHNINFELVCSICSHKFTGHDTFERHLLEHYERCEHDYCEYATDSIDDLEIHLKCHDPGSKISFKCTVCGFRPPQYPENWNLMHDHIVEQHPQLMRSRFRCQRCGQNFQHQQQFDTHYKFCTRISVTCGQCGQSVPSSQLKQHDCAPADSKADKKVSKLQAVDTNSEGNDAGQNSAPAPNFQCLRHELVFQNEDDFENHRITKHGRPHSKPKHLADYVTVTESSKVPDSGRARRQQETDTEEPCDEQAKPSSNKNPEIPDAPSEPIRCRHCYKVFANRQRLSNHCQRSHSSEKLQSVACSKCPKTFRNKIQRRNHIRCVHEGVKRIQTNRKKVDKNYHLCTLCGYLTPEKKRLDNHILAVHQGIMPYTCDMCDYKTKENSDLQRHRAKHLGIKKHQCAHCSYKTNERWLLVNHCQKQHGVSMSTLSRDTMGCAFSLRNKAKEAKERLQGNPSMVSDVLVPLPSTGDGTEANTNIIVVDHSELVSPHGDPSVIAPPQIHPSQVEQFIQALTDQSSSSQTVQNPDLYCQPSVSGTAHPSFMPEQILE